MMARLQNIFSLQIRKKEAETNRIELSDLANKSDLKYVVNGSSLKNSTGNLDTNYPTTPMI
jgi:hypothetical protein